MKKLLFPWLAIIMLFTIASCDYVDKSNNADTRQMEATKDSLAEAERQIGMPHIINWQQRKLMKWVYEMCDREDLICYAYTKNNMTGKYTFLYKCLGFGIPFSAQFTNSEKLVEGDKYFGYDLPGTLNYLEKLPQADPNGLYMPTSSSATWVISIQPGTNEPKIIYAEPEVIISAFPLRKSLLENPGDYGIYSKDGITNMIVGY